jgi:alpha-tubulin suppressor-like RCC1 family protein
LVASGVAGAPVVFTSIHDDSAGGDTDGVSTPPVAGDYSGIYVAAGGLVNLSNAQVRYGTVGIATNAAGATTSLNGVTVDHVASVGVQDTNGGTVTVTNGSFSFTPTAISLSSTTSTSPTITNTTVSDSSTGITASGLSVPTIHGSSFVRLTTAVRKTGSGTVDARNNWWGSASGPSPLGTGAAISGSVTVNPWCLDPACTSFSTSVSPTTGSIGQVVTVTGQYWPASLGATLRFTTGTDAGTATVDVNGILNGTIVVGASEALGSNPIVVTSGATSATIPFTVLPPTFAPDPPTGLSVMPGDGSASVSFDAPASDGGSPITGYEVSCASSTGGVAASNGGLSSPIVVPELTNGATYTCVVTATNAVGTGPASVASNAFVPATVPDPPSVTAALPGDGSASVAFVAPSSDGGSAITDYSVTVHDGSGGVPSGVTGATTRLVGSATTTLDFTGLTNGTVYTFTVAAMNVAGTGADSALSSPVTPRTMPGAPTGVSAKPGNKQATVTWSAPASNGGDAIGNYQATVYNATGGAAVGVTGAATRSVGSPATTFTFTGLSNGASYTFKVAAMNGAGAGAQSAPTFAVKPLATTFVAAGANHSCAVMADGTARCWGRNQAGQIGDGTLVNRTSSVAVSGLTGAMSIAAGANHTCARLSTGAVKCWGSNAFGQIGDNTTTMRKTPVAVSGLSSGVVQLAAGTSHTCALISGGTVKCWGLNSSGQLGDGTTTMRKTPVLVSGLSGVTQIAAGGNHTCARLSSGAVKCWGQNASGQVGDGSTTQRLTPIAVSGLSGAMQVAAGANHTCVRLSTGAVKCWGSNALGQIGDNTTTMRKTPVAVSGLSSGVIQLAAGTSHTCALISGGTVRCWGLNSSGQLGDGTTTMRKTSVVSTAVSGSGLVATGGNHTLTRNATTGGLRAWGNNTYGQLGDGTTTNRSTSVMVTNLS